MNERLAAVLARFASSAPPGPAPAAVDVDGRIITRDANGRVFVQMPSADPSSLYGPAHATARVLPPATLRELGCTDRTPWSPGRLVLLAGRHSAHYAAGLGQAASRWGARHAPVRWVSAETAPHEYRTADEKPVAWNLPVCGTLIIGKVWPGLSTVQLDHLTRACQDRRGRSVIIAAEFPDPMPDRWRVLAEYCRRDGAVVLTDKLSGAGQRAPLLPEGSGG